MIGVPFDNNDLSCLGSITEVVAELVAQPDPGLVELATQYPTTEALAAWIRSLPQRNDEGAPGDGPKVDACLPPQRLRIPAPDPNCVERAALYVGVAELIDPTPIRQLATLDFDWGRHTFPIENGAPIVLDPRVTVDDLARAVAPRKRAPVAVDVHEAIDYTAELALTGAEAVRNGPSRARLARNAIRSLVDTGKAPTDPDTIDAIGWFFATAESVAHGYGLRALTIVRTTARAISDLVDDILARRQRNLSFEIGGDSFAIPSWLSGLGSLVGKIGLDVGAVALAPKLAALGISGQMLDLVEQELNAEGLSLGPLAKPGRSFTSALNSLSHKQTT
jgi:hypothetical protein